MAGGGGGEGVPVFRCRRQKVSIRKGKKKEDLCLFATTTTTTATTTMIFERKNPCSDERLRMYVILNCQW